MKEVEVDAVICGATKKFDLSHRTEVTLECGMTDDEHVTHLARDFIDGVSVTYRWT